ncbi:hypothetical protein E2562_014897 [Oryza meyeriana var. granulata]|uniref:Uncharacterized protein n=1 Tax=Oryza meyeriana var. granulata TaxID=110450 RepID=A0A6G1EIY3_9ORYZ|nr:hypothetical protein E2562_014897 [Oryza meyeriana var. granulata]
MDYGCSGDWGGRAEHHGTVLREGGRGGAREGQECPRLQQPLAEDAHRGRLGAASRGQWGTTCDGAAGELGTSRTAAGGRPGVAAVPNPNPSQRPIGIGVMGSGDLPIWLPACRSSVLCVRM